MRSMTSGKTTIVYQQGEVVLLPFPFTDLSATKTRPAVVVSTETYHMATGALIVAMITSVQHDTPYDYELKDWRAAHLLQPSWVRAKLATLSPSLVRYKPGRLSVEDLGEVERRIHAALGHG